MTHEGKDLTRSSRLEALATAYNTLDMTRLTSIMASIGKESFVDLHRGTCADNREKQDSVRPVYPAAQMELDILSMVAAAGVDLEPIKQRLMQEIIVRDSLEAHDFLRRVIGCTEQYSHNYSLRWVASTCGPNMAPIIAQEVENAALRYRLGDTDALESIMPDYCSGVFLAKSLAILLYCAVDLVPVFTAADMDNTWEGLSPEVRDLISAASSNHGCVHLRRLEPSLIDILGRN